MARNCHARQAERANEVFPFLPRSSDSTFCVSWRTVVLITFDITEESRYDIT